MLTRNTSGTRTSAVRRNAALARHASRLCRAWLILCCTIAGCEQAPTKSAARSLTAQESTLAVQVFETYANLAHSGYGDSALGAKRLLSAVNSFLERPTAEGFDAARTAWLTSRHSYQQTEVFRFYDGPIDEVETLVNTWPIDENYVESGHSGAKPGLIEDSTTYPELTSHVLANVNLKDGETSVSTGYHVIEFLLWGRDTRTDGPGDRSFTDYVVGPAASKKHKPDVKLATVKTSADSTQPNDDVRFAIAKRRGAYLRAATELLLENLTRVQTAWAPATPGNYRERFLKLPPLQSMALILKGMGALSGAELSGERLTVAYETKDQENEHSCFSDSTHIDMWRNAQGIQNVCLGRYERVEGGALDGTGLCELVGLRDQALAERLKKEIEQSVTETRAIPAPFDQAIQGDDDAPGRQAVQRAIVALRQQTMTLASVAAAFDVRVSLAGAAK